MDFFSSCTLSKESLKKERDDRKDAINIIKFLKNTGIFKETENYFNKAASNSDSISRSLSLQSCFAPYTGGNDCRILSFLLMDITQHHEEMSFNEVTKDVQETLMLIHLLTPRNERDKLDMIGKKDLGKKRIPINLLNLLKQSLLLTDQQYIKNLAHELDYPVEKLAVNEKPNPKGFRASSTTPQIELLLKQCQKYTIPLVLKLQILRTDGAKLYGIEEGVIQFIYDKKVQDFVTISTDTIDPTKLAICIRGFSIKKSNLSKEESHFLSLMSDTEKKIV